MLRAENLRILLMVGLVWCVPASACLVKYELSSSDSPIYLQAVLTTAGDWVSLTINDRSDSLLVQQDLLTALQQQQSELQLLSQVLQQQQETALSIVRAVGGASLAAGAGGALSATLTDAYSLELSSSFPSLSDITIPLSCIGSCGGEIESQWSYLGATPEPGTLALVGLGLAGLGFTRRRKV